jgi:tRNA modification GTPase
MVSLRIIRSGAGAILDQGLVVFFPGPGSFTGEDVAELHLHGGRAVVAAVLAELGRLPGFRPAEAGEFTRRAFANGRLDLTQVEGLADLILADTEHQRRQAIRQAGGGLGRLYEDWRQRLIAARALVEAELDFADEDDVPPAVGTRAWGEVAAVAAAMAEHLADRRGERLREGAEVVVLGPVNSGKSSLINAVARRDVAIVTPEPGTTRDMIEVRLDLDGFPVTLVDTAGLREAEGAVEREGIRRAAARADAADLVLWLGDATAPAVAPPPLPGPVLRVCTKADLLVAPEDRARAAAAHDFLISSASGEGVPALLAAVTARAMAALSPGESALMTRARHRAAVTAAAEALVAALVEDGRALELRAEDLRRASDALARVTGRIDVEDLLDVIFRDFCIGK